MTDSEAAFVLQGLYRTHRAQMQMHSMITHMWQRVRDPNSGRFYYVNTTTQEVKWTRPLCILQDEDLLTPRSFKHRDEVERLERKAKARGGPMEYEEAALLIQGLFRTKKARDSLKSMMRGIYKKVYDPAKGVSYYYNTRTGAAQWTKPKILGDDDCPSFDKDHDHIANAEEKKKFSKRLRTHPLTELESALMIQNSWRTRDARRKMHLLMMGRYEKVGSAP
jgi:hypothetical protein